MRDQILVIGSLNMDLVVRAPRHPQEGETILGNQFSTFPGGKGANQAVAAARLGTSVTMIGKVGNDAFGHQLIQIQEKEKINTQWIDVVNDQPTGVALITVNEKGYNTIVVVPGANACLESNDLIHAKQAFEQAAIVILQLETPLETVQYAIEQAKEHQIPILLNPAPAQQLPEEILRKVDVLIPNQHELLILSGQPDMESAIDYLLSLGVKQLIVTLGEDGVLLVSRNERFTIPAFRVKAVDTVAAGDAFVGAFAVSIMRG